MSVFSYIAKSRHGEELSGHLAGENLDEVIAELHTMGLAVLHIHESRGPLLAGFLNWLRELSPPKASKRELALFSRQLATVLESGIPLSRGLRGLASDKGGRGMGKTILDVCDRIERGESLSKALEAHPAVFNSMYQSMVRAGERAGTLDSVVEHLAVYLEKSDAIRTKVKSALSYPVFIMVFAALAILLMLVKIVPTFAKLYTDLGADLPTLTRIMIESSAFVQGHFLSGFLLSALTLIGLFFSLRTERGKYLWHSFLLSMPLFGVILKKSVMSRFTRTLGILLESGLPVLEALELVGAASGNAVIHRAVMQVRAQVEAGQALTPSFRSTGKFPEMVLQLMSTGEESGGLDTMLRKTSDFYDREVEASVHGISTLIEPLMIVIVGLMLGVMVLGMFLPIFTLGEAVMRGGHAL